MDVQSNSNQDSISKTDKQLKRFIERLSEEKNNVNFDIKEVLSEARAMAYNPKIMKKILALQKMYIEERVEQEALLDNYRNALGIY